MHYPPSVLPKLRELATQYLPADGWLTRHELSKAVTTMSQRWVCRNLEKHFSAEGKKRLDLCGKPIMHYPPSVLPKLRELATQYLPADEVAAEIWRSRSWVLSHLAGHFPDVGEMRRKPQMKPAMHYPPSVLPKLRELAEHQPPAGGWVTVCHIAGQVKKGRQWVQARLNEHFPNEGELRVDCGGRSFMHYPPSVLPKLRELAAASPRKVGISRIS
jgi:hypothetical protein